MKALIYLTDHTRKKNKGAVKSMRRFLTEAGIKEAGTQNDEI
ncbi:hypothetical protein [uncultured Nostoc sp.]